MSWSIVHSNAFKNIHQAIWILLGASLAFPSAYGLQNVLIYSIILVHVFTLSKDDLLNQNNILLFVVAVGYVTFQCVQEQINLGDWDVLFKKIPLLLVFVSIRGIDEVNAKKWFQSLGIFSVISAFFLFIHHFIELSEWERFQWRPYTYNFLTESLGWQPIYTAISYSIGAIFWIDLWQKTPNRRIKLFSGLAFLVLFFVIIMLSTRTALFALVLGAFMQLRGKQKWLIGAGIAVGLVFVLNNPILKERVIHVFSGTQTYAGGSIRAQKWKAAWQVGIHFWTCGTSSGRAQIELEKQYEHNKFTLGIQEHYNAHQQWLQLWVEGGIWGILFIGIVAILFLLQWKNRWIVWNISGVILLINSLTESILERQNGMILFSIIFLVGYVQNSYDKNTDVQKV